MNKAFMNLGIMLSRHHEQGVHKSRHHEQDIHESRHNVIWAL